MLRSLYSLLWIWVTVWSAIVLFQAANRIRMAQSAGDPDQLAEAIDKVCLCFKIAGIAALIGLILGGVALCTAFSLLPTSYETER